MHRFDFARAYVVVASLPLLGATAFLAGDASGAPDLVWLTAALSGLLVGTAAGWRFRHGAGAWKDALLDAVAAVVLTVGGVWAAVAAEAPTHPLSARIATIAAAWIGGAAVGVGVGLLWGRLMRPVVRPTRAAAASRATAVGAGVAVALAMLLPAAITGGMLAGSAPAGTPMGTGLRSLLSAVVLGPGLSPSAVRDVGVLATAHVSTTLLAVSLLSALIGAATIDRRLSADGERPGTGVGEAK